MEKLYELNKNAAPKDWVKFKRWYRLPSFNLPFTVEEAWVKLLGRKLPKDDSKRIKKKIK